MARRRVWVPIFNSASLAAGAQVKVDLLQNLGLDLESVGGENMMSSTTSKNFL